MSRVNAKDEVVPQGANDGHLANVFTYVDPKTQRFIIQPHRGVQLSHLTCESFGGYPSARLPTVKSSQFAHEPRHFIRSGTHHMKPFVEVREPFATTNWATQERREPYELLANSIIQSEYSNVGPDGQKLGTFAREPVQPLKENAFRTENVPKATPIFRGPAGGRGPSTTPGGGNDDDESDDDDRPPPMAPIFNPGNIGPDGAVFSGDGSAGNQWAEWAYNMVFPPDEDYQVPQASSAPPLAQMFTGAPARIAASPAEVSPVSPSTPRTPDMSRVFQYGQRPDPVVPEESSQSWLQAIRSGFNEKLGKYVINPLRNMFSTEEGSPPSHAVVSEEELQQARKNLKPEKDRFHPAEPVWPYKRVTKEQVQQGVDKYPEEWTKDDVEIYEHLRHKQLVVDFYNELFQHGIGNPISNDQKDPLEDGMDEDDRLPSPKRPATSAQRFSVRPSSSEEMEVQQEEQPEDSIGERPRVARTPRTFVSPVPELPTVRQSIPEQDQNPFAASQVRHPKFRHGTRQADRLYVPPTVREVVRQRIRSSVPSVPFPTEYVSDNVNPGVPTQIPNTRIVPVVSPPIRPVTPRQPLPGPTQPVDMEALRRLDVEAARSLANSDLDIPANVSIQSDGPRPENPAPQWMYDMMFQPEVFVPPISSPPRMAIPSRPEMQPVSQNPVPPSEGQVPAPFGEPSPVQLAPLVIDEDDEEADQAIVIEDEQGALQQSDAIEESKEEPPSILEYVDNINRTQMSEEEARLAHILNVLNTQISGQMWNHILENMNQQPAVIRNLYGATLFMNDLREIYRGAAVHMRAYPLKQSVLVRELAQFTRSMFRNFTQEQQNAVFAAFMHQLQWTSTYESLDNPLQAMHLLQQKPDSELYRQSLLFSLMAESLSEMYPDLYSLVSRELSLLESPSEAAAPLNRLSLKNDRDPISESSEDDVVFVKEIIVIDGEEKEVEPREVSASDEMRELAESLDEFPGSSASNPILIDPTSPVHYHYRVNSVAGPSDPLQHASVLRRRYERDAQYRTVINRIHQNDAAGLASFNFSSFRVDMLLDDYEYLRPYLAPNPILAAEDLMAPEQKQREEEAHNLPDPSSIDISSAIGAADNDSDDYLVRGLPREDLMFDVAAERYLLERADPIPEDVNEISEEDIDQGMVTGKRSRRRMERRRPPAPRSPIMTRSRFAALISSRMDQSQENQEDEQDEQLRERGLEGEEGVRRSARLRGLQATFDFGALQRLQNSIRRERRNRKA